jgi:hypothetical protein
MESKTYTRGKFFGTIGKGALYTFLASVLPVKLLSAKNFYRKKIDIHIHPSAVKRINKVQ